MSTKREAMRVLDLATEQPWLITDAGLRLVFDVAQRAGEPDKYEALATQDGRAYARESRIVNGVAVIEVVGPIFRYANLFTMLSGATSTEMLAKDIRQAVDDPLVKAIVLSIDSPGGMAAGINELGNLVFEAREKKRIVAYSGGTIASAAYWIGSAAEQIVIDRTTVGGSIGAKMTILDSSGRDAKAGLRQIEIVSSQSPDKVLDPNQDAGKAKLQRIVDDLAQVFVETVARNRGVDVETVLANFGRGGVFVGDALVTAGMADRLGSLENVIAELSADRLPTRSSSMSTPNKSTPKGPITIATTAELRQALADGHTAEEITVKSIDLDAIKAEAKTAGKTEAEAGNAEAVKKAGTDATAAERKRIADLQTVAMPGFEAELTKAISEGTSAADFAVTQAKAAKERGTTLTQQRKDAPQALPHGGAAPAPEAAKGSWSGVTASMNERTKKKAARR